MRHRRRSTLLSMAGLMALNACAPGDSQPIPPNVARAIDATFADMDRPDVPGASVAVIRDGRLSFSKGYGSAQLEHRVPITSRTVFHVASVSKQFTAMAVTLLAAEGALGLDDRVQEHLPWVPELGRPVTVRQMIHHTSGIRDQWELLGIAGWRLDDVITTEHVKTLMRRQEGLNFEPNSEYLYSNMGYTLLAQVAETLGGSTFPTFAAERIFRPLGMERTHFHDDHQMIVPGRAYSYAPTGSGEFEKSVLSYANAGATSLFTTAEDLALWLDNFRHQRVGGSAVMAQMQNRGVLNNGDTIPYAHGLSMGEYRGLATIGHGGADAGFRTAVTWFPEVNVGIVVLTNVSNGNPQGRLFQVADAVIGDGFPEPLETRDEGSATEQSPPVALSAEVLDRATGRFRTTLGITVGVEREGDRLLLRVPDLPPSRMNPRSANEFHIWDLDLRARFRADWSGFTLLTPDGEEVGSGDRLPDVVPDETVLEGYAGTYYSPELDALYHVSVEDGLLIAQHVRHGDIRLEAVLPDEFVSERWFLGTVRFRRNPSGTVDGFQVTGGRVRDLRFVRLASSLPSRVDPG
ncbi:MAG: serine hydrolase [Gemmatimonadetes bacterium]|nr:serine hydrolase [Gemmatimonadota bacterium]